MNILECKAVIRPVVGKEQLRSGIIGDLYMSDNSLFMSVIFFVPAYITNSASVENHCKSGGCVLFLAVIVVVAGYRCVDKAYSNDIFHACSRND